MVFLALYEGWLSALMRSTSPLIGRLNVRNCWSRITTVSAV